MDVATQAVTEEELPKVFEVIDKNPGLLALILGHGIVTMDKTAVKAGQTDRVDRRDFHDQLGTEKV